MSMVRLIYASRFARGVGPNDIQDIVRVSRKHNEEIGVTGVLCYDPHFFLQCLEGDRDAVNELYNHIIRDERHKNIRLLEYSDIDERVFPSWSMAYIRIDEITRPILLKYGTTATFDPFTMSARQSLGFIQEIAAERHKFLEKARQSLTGKSS